MPANDLFKETGEMRTFNPEVNVATPISEFEYAFRHPEGKLINLIGQVIYDALKEHYNSGAEDAVFDIGVKLLQGALANLAGYNIYIMKAAERNAEKMYKYQEDLQMSLYLNNANAELGQLLLHLDENTVKYPSWPNTNLYKTRVDQIIKTHTEFGRYYYIDESAFFFSRLVFLMKEITADKITPIIGKFTELDAETDANIIEKTKLALAYLTVAMSIRRFDFIELPKTIRNNVSDERSRTIRTGGMEERALAKVSSEIEGKGIMYLADLDRMMEKKNTGTLEVPEDFHEDGDTFYLQT